MKICGVLQVALLMAANSLYADTAKFTALVLDYDTGRPIPGVTVRANFTKNIGWRAWSDSAKPDVDIKETDNDGRCRLSGKTNCGEACCWVPEPPQGYYSEGGWGYEYKKKNLFGVWQPDNLVATIRLQRVEHPIPLIVKRSKGEFRERKQWHYFQYADYRDLSRLSTTNDVPVVRGTVLSYDFLKGSYLPPYGDGEEADVSFVFDETIYTWQVVEGPNGVALYKKFRRDVSVDFKGKGNGLREVPCTEDSGILLRTASHDGYSGKIGLWYAYLVGEPTAKTNCDNKRCYAFRIRTKYDEGGNVKSAYYGKIYGDFNIKDIEGVSFLYYLNPSPNDRNLEWDMKHNLCSDPGDLSEPQP